MEILKSAQSKSLKIPEYGGFDPETRKVNMGIREVHSCKEFVCLRIKQEKNVMMPHEYKMIVLIFLHNMFKGMKVDLSEYFDEEIGSFDLEDLSLSRIGDKHVLITAEEKIFDY